jgi:hypothetical protein
MSFRPAEAADCEMLWRWRLDDERAEHYGGASTTFGTHEAWFARNRDRIRIWEQDGKPVGAVRIESDGTVHFSIDRAHKDSAPVMILNAMGAKRRHGGRLKALVDRDDTFRIEVFKRAGFKRFPAVAMIYKP